ncbi:MAG: trans-sulfuration enzyme family protein [Acidobacteriota bacterium]
MKKTPPRIDTRVVHAGDPEPRVDGTVSLPIFQTAMFLHAGEADYHDLRYIRLNNTPNQVAAARKLASLENAEAALVAGSGMAAITTTLLSLLGSGDHLLVQNTLYGGTHDFLAQDLGGFGVAHDFIDTDDPASWKERLRPTTKAIYVESMSNPLLQVGDLEAVAAFAREHGLFSVIDNTFPSPINFRPLDHGFDLSLHSCTKYLNGHSDIVAGAVIGRGELVERVRRKLNHLGGTLDPHACFLLSRGMKTLALRVHRQNDSALRLAGMLEQQDRVQRVNYPGLPAHPRHERARALFDGFGGMMSFELEGGLDTARRFMQALRIPLIAPSLGGVESLVTLPATTSHLGMPPEERRRRGITDGLIRVSVGIEACEDLLEDFDQALRRATS